MRRPKAGMPLRLRGLPNCAVRGHPARHLLKSHARISTEEVGKDGDRSCLKLTIIFKLYYSMATVVLSAGPADEARRMPEPADIPDLPDTDALTTAP